MKRLIIVGSPRVGGRSAHLAEMLFEANIDEHPEDELFLVPVSEVEVGPCIGCNACREKSGVILKGEDGKEVTVQRHRCVFDDDMQTLYDLIDDVDEVTVVSPVYFSGAPASLKCLLDRLQPYYWANVNGSAGTMRAGGKRECNERASEQRSSEKRPAELHVIGEGGDPHGYDALVSEVTSALAVAGFRLRRILDWVGKIDESGEIVAEAREVQLDDAGKKRRPKLSLSADEPQQGHQLQERKSSQARQASKKKSQQGRQPRNSRSGDQQGQSDRNTQLPRNSQNSQRAQQAQDAQQNTLQNIRQEKRPASKQTKGSQNKGVSKNKGKRRG